MYGNAQETVSNLGRNNFAQSPPGDESFRVANYALIRPTYVYGIYRWSYFDIGLNKYD